MRQSILFSKKDRPLAQVATLSREYRNGQLVAAHCHPEDQLIFASKGVMTVRTGVGIWVVPPLRAVWIPARTPHSLRMAGQVSMRTLYFLPGFVRSLPRTCFVVNVSPLLVELILHACKFPRLNKKLPARKRIIDIVVDQLEAADAIPLQLPSPADRRALRVVQALLANPGDQRPLQILCKECGASRRTIQRLFLAETGMTFARWRQQLRLLHALERLAAGENVTSAALDAGYDSPSAFISMFKKQLGTTPARYFRGNGAL